jgi:hypothetical protein
MTDHTDQIKRIVEYVQLHEHGVSIAELCEAFSEECQMDHLFENRPATEPTPERSQRQGDFQTALILALPYLDFELEVGGVAWLRAKKPE